MGEIKLSGGQIVLHDGANNVTKYMKCGANGALQIFDSNGVLDQELGDLQGFKQVKRDSSGSVSFAATADARGTTATTGSLTTGSSNLSKSLTARANFVKGVAKIGSTTGTATGTLALKIMSGTTTLTSVTTTPSTKTFSTTAENVNAANPKVVLDISGLGQGTLKTVTLTEQLNEFVTPQVPLA